MFFAFPAQSLKSPFLLNAGEAKTPCKWAYDYGPEAAGSRKQGFFASQDAHFPKKSASQRKNEIKNLLLNKNGINL
jgi:hypothetical protein